MTGWHATLHSALDELALAVVLGETWDRARLAATVGRVVEAVPETAPFELRARVDALVEASSVYARDRTNGGFADAIVAAQAALSGLLAPAAEVAVIPGLPPWVDRALLTEYLGSARLGLESLESALLATEGGDAESLRAARSLLHGLKGEAGTVGLDEVSAVCHALEDALADAPTAERLERMLAARDWLASGLDALARGGTRPGDPAAVIAALAAPPPTVPMKASAPTGPAAFDEETVSLFLEFYDESTESLGRADATLVELERGDAGPDGIHSLFRTFHSIKGVASFLEQHLVAKLAHATEEVLGQVREGLAPYDGRRSDAVFEATAMMRQLLDAARTGIAEGRHPERPDGFDALVERLHGLLARTSAVAAPPVPPEFPAEEAPIPGPRVAAQAIFEVVTPSAPTELPAEDRPVPGPAAAAHAVLLAAAPTPARAPTSPPAATPPLRAVAPPEPRPPARDGAEPAEAAAADGGRGEGRVMLKDTVKVDLERVDALVELIGELAIIEAMVVHDPEIAALSSQRVRHRLAQLSKVSRDLQRRGLGLRMVPLSSVFQKMSRVVRDVARRANKQVRLVVAGEATEMDRGLVEQINDPLVHLVRNAIDHGIETPDARVASGKAPVGTVELRAGQEGGNIVITIKEDGRGLDRDKILARAVERGLVTASAGAQMPDREVWELIFSPGFSTAEKVTEISGRGVGMDVVRKNVEAMRGRIRIETVPGQGTSFHLVLPLTLAIIDGMLFRCGDERFVLPTHAIVEALVPEPGMLRRFADRTPVLFLRGHLLPVVHLGDLLGVSGVCAREEEGLAVILETGAKRVAVIVDEVLGQQQVVIKTLSGVATQGGRFNGAAILSDGNVGLILDPGAIARDRAGLSSELAA